MVDIVPSPPSSPADASARSTPPGVEGKPDPTFVDAHTGLHNRRFLYPYVQKHLAAQPHSGPLSLLLLDIQGFRKINATHGEAAGDALIGALAERLQGATLPRAGVRLVRLAGDRFVVVLPGRKGDVAALADRVRRKLCRDPYTVAAAPRPSRVDLNISAGLAEAPEDGTTVRDLLDAADRALRGAREQGLDRVALAGEHAPHRPLVADLLRGFPCPRLVGRATELARCESLSHLGERGPTTLVLLRGEGGVGKSRLLCEMQRRRAAAGDLTLWVTCREEVRTAPYSVIAELLGTLVQSHPEAAAALIESLGEDEARVLARRVPALQRLVAPGTAEQDRVWRSRFFTVTLEALRFLGRERRLCLLLDDLQLADAATLKVLTFLMRHDRQDTGGAGVPMFATITTCAGDIERENSSAFGHFERFTASWPTVGTVELGALDPDGVRAMIDACFEGHHFPPELTGRLHHVTGGSPLLVEEVLVVLAVSGVIVADGLSWRLDRHGHLALPRDLGELLEQHLAHLDEETSDALKKASVIGSRFSVSLLHRVLDINEGRAAQLTDRAVDFRLLREGDPAARDDLRFASPRIQRLTYAIVGDDVRRDVHRKVAALKEDFEILDLDDALAEIAWHHEREGDTALAAAARGRHHESARALYLGAESDHYVEDAGRAVAPHIDAMIPEAIEPVPPRILETMPVVMKGIMTVLRGVQMYPPGSEFVRRALRTAADALRPVLSEVEAVTWKERGGALELNAQVLDLDAVGALADDFVRTFRRARIHSVTITRAAGPADLSALALSIVQCSRLAARGEGADAVRWASVLQRHGGRRGIGVVPKEYRATSAGEALLGPGARLEGLARESARHLPLLKDILRFTAGTAEAILLYPRGSETVTRALGGLESALARAHVELASVNLGVTPEGFLVNDLRLDGRIFGDSVAAMLQLFERAGITSLSFGPGVTSADIEALFRTLGAEPETRGEAPLAWSERLRAAGVSQVGIDEYVFVAADAQAAEVSSEHDAPLEAPETGRLDREALLRRIFDGAPADVLDPAVRDGLPELLTDLVLDEEQELPRRIVARLFENLADPDEAIRGNTLALLDAVLSATTRVVARTLERLCAPALGPALRDERAPEPIRRLIALSSRVAEHLLRDGELRDASRILWQLGAGFQADERVDQSSREQSRRVVSRLMQTDAFERALASLWTPNERRRALALHLLESCGESATEHLIQLALDSPDDRTRWIHAEQLAAIARGPTVTDRLTALVTPYAQAQRAIHALELLERLGCDPVSALVRAFQHPHDGVADAAAALVRRLDAETARTALSRLGRFEDPRLKATVVGLIAEINPPDAARQLLTMLRDPSTPPPLEVEIVHALGRTGDERVVDDLAAVLRVTWWDRLLNRAPPSELRVAAIWALGTLGHERALAAVRAALDDHDARVRSAADAVIPESLDALP